MCLICRSHVHDTMGTHTYTHSRNENDSLTTCNGPYERFVYTYTHNILSALWLMPLMVSTLTNPTKQQAAAIYANLRCQQ